MPMRENTRCLFFGFAFKCEMTKFVYLQKQSCGQEEAGLLLDSVAEEVSQRLQRVVWRNKSKFKILYCNTVLFSAY